LRRTASCVLSQLKTTSTAKEYREPEEDRHRCRRPSVDGPWGARRVPNGWDLTDRTAEEILTPRRRGDKDAASLLLSLAVPRHVEARLAAYPQLSAVRLLHEIRAAGQRAEVLQTSALLRGPSGNSPRGSDLRRRIAVRGW
jgi:hypothetical protein